MGCLGNSSKTAEDQGVDEKERREANKKIEKQLQKERLAYKATHRLLLLGKARVHGRCDLGSSQRPGVHSPGLTVTGTGKPDCAPPGAGTWLGRTTVTTSALYWKDPHVKEEHVG